MDPMCPDEGWFGGNATLAVNGSVSGNNALYVVTPREVGRLILMDVCRQPIRIRNAFWEYLEFGPGLQPKTCTGLGCNSQFQAYERDNVVTFAPLLSTPQKIRIFPTDARDTALRVLLQGRDQNGQVITNTDPGTGLTAPGEYLQLAFPFVTSVNQFSTITGIQKDQTYGQLQFFQVDPTSGAENSLSTMDPNEGVADYRRYLINGIPNVNLCCQSPAGVVQISAQARLDFIPVQNETDYLLIQNVPALVEESQSIRLSRMDSQAAQQNSLVHHARALALLNGQLDAKLGKINTAVRMPLFGSNRMRQRLPG